MISLPIDYAGNERGLDYSASGLCIRDNGSAALGDNTDVTHFTRVFRIGRLPDYLLNVGVGIVSARRYLRLVSFSLGGGPRCPAVGAIASEIEIENFANGPE